MNCILFPENAPLKLESGHPKLEHIIKVLRTKNGGEIFAGNINGDLNICSISYDDNGGATLTPIRQASNPRRLPAGIAVSYARPQIAQRLLFEAACFGVENLVFYPASKGEADYAKSSLYSSGEYLKWLERGAEQACSTYIPHFEYANSLEHAIDLLEDLGDANAINFAPDIYEAEASFSDAFMSYNPVKDEYMNIILGSERGFTNADRDTLRNRGYTLVSLGERVLRTDTALISVLALLHNL
ncbi:MAG: RsmE family RNA methyltransferase [Opitutales bacterium]|nr:RsmE family RNA methyltransferase [Opitutales bacterium]